jgi:Leucine-rich repeat (LRR) protein
MYSIEPIQKGVVVIFNEKKIVVAFENDIEPSTLPKNICLVQLTNQITYDKIKDSLERLEQL